MLQNLYKYTPSLLQCHTINTLSKLWRAFRKSTKNIHTSLGQLDDVVGSTTKAINREVMNVESLPAIEDMTTLEIKVNLEEISLGDKRF